MRILLKSQESVSMPMQDLMSSVAVTVIIGPITYYNNYLHVQMVQNLDQRTVFVITA